jgi:hypothetical protein
VLWAVAGSVEGAHRERAELELEAVVEGLVLVLGVRESVDVDRGAGRRREAPVAGDVVGVVVGLEHVVDAHTQIAGELEVVVDLEPRVDHGRRAGRMVAHEVRGTAEIVVRNLAEDHQSTDHLTAPRARFSVWANGYNCAVGLD